MAVTDQAIARIRTMIRTGELAPGSRLPPEKELSEQLGLSRNSMREAIKALEVMQVLTVRQGDGTYVTSLDPRMLSDLFSFVIDVQGDASLASLFAVRRLLEGETAAIAARLMSDETIRRLFDVGEEAMRSTDKEVLMALDLEFHASLADATGNPFLAAILDSLSSESLRQRNWDSIAATPHTLADVIVEHREIVEAIARRDPELARAAAVRHTAETERRLRVHTGA